MINIAKILKHFPKGTLLYCSIIGYCKLFKVTEKDEDILLINDQYTVNDPFVLSSDGTYDVSNSCELWLVDEEGYRQQNWKDYEKNFIRIENDIRGFIVAISDDINGEFHIGRYIGDGKARIIASPNNKTDWKYIIPYSYYVKTTKETKEKYNIKTTFFYYYGNSK